MLAWSLKVVEEFNLFCAGAHPLFKPSVPDRTRQRAIQLPFQSGQCVGPISYLIIDLFIIYRKRRHPATIVARRVVIRRALS